MFSHLPSLTLFHKSKLMRQDVRCLIKVLTVGKLKLRPTDSQTNRAFSKFSWNVKLPKLKETLWEKRANANPNENNLTIGTWNKLKSLFQIQICR